MVQRVIFRSHTADLISIRHPSSWVRLSTLWLSALLFTSPCLSEAVQLGDILSMSKLGEPLRVEVELSTAAHEEVDNSCVSLVAPDTKVDDANHYLRDAKLSVQNNGGQQRVLLSSHKPFNEVFAKFKLEVKCRDQGSIAKTFTLLPDMPDSEPLREQILPTIAQAIAPQLKAEPQPAKQVPPSDLVTDTPAVASAIAPQAHTHQHAHKTMQTGNDQPRTVRHHAQSPTASGFKLKISGNPLDASRIGKISPEERNFLLGSQKLLDSDDQMASILTLQNQVKQLQEDITDMRAKLALLGPAAHINQSNEVVNTPASPTESTNTVPVAASAPVAVATVQAAEMPAIKATKKSDWSTWVWPLGLLGLAILGVVFGLRRYAGKKSVTAPSPIFPETRNKIEPNQSAAPLRVIQSISPVIPTQAAPEKSVPSKADPTIRTAIFNAREAASTPETALIEEANLYVAFNHPLRATKILQELVTEHPAMTEAWLLLFGILSSLSKENEFEENARNFLRHNPDDAKTWATIQALGRTLNISHPLYRKTSTPMSPEELLDRRPPLGDTLIDLDLVLPENMHYCLADFNKDKHGRFGAYLVSQKVITHTQLTQALVHQDNLASQGEGSSATIDITSPLTVEFSPPENRA